MKCAKADYHTHSSFSLDSQASTEEMTKTALSIGLSEICFTEHKDLDIYYKWKNYYQDESYSKEISKLQENFKGRIKIKKGVELDFQTNTIPDFERFLSEYRFDFVIASVHALEHEFVGPHFFVNKSHDQVYRDYFNEVISLSKLSSFDVIGHLDYIKRFGAKKKPVEPEKFNDQIEGILSNLIRNNKGIEINTSGWRHPPQEPYPSPYILKKFKKMGGEIITIGSDAHRPEDIASNMERAVDILKNCGFTGYFIFTGRDPKKIMFD